MKKRYRCTVCTTNVVIWTEGADGIFTPSKSANGKCFTGTREPMTQATIDCLVELDCMEPVT